MARTDFEISEICLQSRLHLDVCDFERGMEISQGIRFPDLQSAMKTSQGKKQVLGSSLPTLLAFAENLGGVYSS